VSNTEKYAQALREVAEVVERFSDDYGVSCHMRGVVIQAFSEEDYKRGAKLLGGTRLKLTDLGVPILRRIFYTSKPHGDSNYHIEWPYVAIDLTAPSSVKCEKVPTGEKKFIKTPVEYEEQEVDVYEYRCPSLYGSSLGG